MLARQFRGAFAVMATGALAFLSACGTDAGPKAEVPCTTTSAQTFTVGQVVPAVATQSICVSGGAAGAEFAVIPFNGSTTFSANASMTFTSTGAVAVTTPALSSALATRTLDVDRSASLVRDFSLDGRLRESERRELTPLVASARAWHRARLARAAQTGGALKASIPSLAVGDNVSLNANADDPCANASMRTGRVVAITNNSVVIADVNNPAGGYTDAEYQSIAVTFDTLVLALDQAAFGNATDIDQNGHIVLFFTRAVNELTEAGNSTSIVGGFFYARDLFPKVATPSFQACASSNVGELFYLMVPDPNGTVNGNVRAKDAVSRLTISTTAHELQHLINASRRLYVNNVLGEDWEEELWLNEGLSHIAEELLFYRESGLAPRQNIDLTTLRASPTRTLPAFNNDQIQNTSRYGSYLRQPSISSPYAPNDSLHTRGATWSLLRYLADHRGAADGDVWSRLVNSSTNGLANLQQVFGTDVTNQVRDWATSVLADDIAGVDARYQQPSWNFRTIFPAMSSFNAFPLQTLAVTDGSPRSVTLRGGGTAFVRFGVAAGSTGSVVWGTPPQNVSVSVVRTR